MQLPRDLVFEITRHLASRAPYRESARPKLQALAAAAQADLLLEVLNEQRLTELLGSRAIALAEESLPTSFIETVRGAVSGSRGRAMALEALALRVTQLLDGEGIPSLPLKGPFLARRLYGDAGLRFVNDLDVLVSRHRIHEAAAAIRQLGYVSDDPPWIEGLPDLHYILRDPERRLPRIELHWRIHWYEEEFSEALLERSEPGDDGLRQSPPEDELAALLLYYARDGFYGLRTAADVAGWWDVYGSTVNAEAVLARHWTDYQPLRRAFTGAALAAQAIVGVPAAAILPPSSSEAVRPRLAVRLACPSQKGEHDQLLGNIRAVDGLLAPPGGLMAFVRRFILLDRREIAIMYDSSSTAGTAMWQVWHVAKVTARYVLCLGGALLPRRRRPLLTRA